MHSSPPPAPPPLPLPPDDRIKKAVRSGQVFNEPYDAARAVAYAQGFLKNGHDLMRPPVLIAIAFGLLLTVGLQFAVGNAFMLVIPVGLFLGLAGYLIWFSANRARVEQALEANRHVAGG